MDTLFLSRVVLGRERVNILHSFPMRCVSNAGQCNNWRGQQQPKQKERGRVSQSQKNKIPFSLLASSSALSDLPRRFFRPIFRHRHPPPHHHPHRLRRGRNEGRPDGQRDRRRRRRRRRRPGSRKTFWGSNGCCQSVTVSGGGRKEGRKGLPWPRASIARGGASARKVGRNSAGEKDARRNFLWSLAAAAAKEGLVPRSTLKTLLLHLAPIPPLLSHCTVGLASRDACCQKPRSRRVAGQLARESHAAMPAVPVPASSPGRSSSVW